jgi:hypothetical protein
MRGGGYRPWRDSSLYASTTAYKESFFMNSLTIYRSIRVMVKYQGLGLEPGFTDEVGRKVERVRVCHVGLAA